MSRRRPSPALDWQLEQGHALYETEDHVEGQRMRDAVNALPEPHRSCVEMRIWGRHTYKEIAEELGMTGRQNAHDHYTRGLEWLRLSMQKDA